MFYKIELLEGFFPNYGSSASCINDAGEVAGISYYNPKMYLPCIWNSLGCQLLSPSTDDYLCVPKRINNQGLIIGKIDKPNRRFTEFFNGSFLYSERKMKMYLPTPNNVGCIFTDLSNQGRLLRIDALFDKRKGKFYHTSFISYEEDVWIQIDSQRKFESLTACCISEEDIIFAQDGSREEILFFSRENIVDTLKMQKVTNVLGCVGDYLLIDFFDHQGNKFYSVIDYKKKAMKVINSTVAHTIHALNENGVCVGQISTDSEIGGVAHDAAIVVDGEIQYLKNLIINEYNAHLEVAFAINKLGYIVGSCLSEGRRIGYLLKPCL